MTPMMASQITSLTIIYWTVYSGADQWKYQSSASLAVVLGIHRWPVNSPHKGPVTRKLFPFDDVIMTAGVWHGWVITSHRKLWEVLINCVLEKKCHYKRPKVEWLVYDDGIYALLLKKVEKWQMNHEKGIFIKPNIWFPQASFGCLRNEIM